MVITIQRSNGAISASCIHANSSQVHYAFVDNLCYPFHDFCDRESAADPSCTTHHGVQSVTLLRHRSSFRLECFNVRLLMQIGQQAGLARTLASLDIDIC